MAATGCPHAGTGRDSTQQYSPIEARACTFIYHPAQACTGTSAVPARNRALAARLLLANTVRRLCTELLQIAVSCLVRATRCLSALENKYSAGPPRASTRVQAKSRAWHKSNFALQGALRGSSKESVKFELSNGRQIVSALSAAVHAMLQ
jgi:hypothetical protein